MRALNSKDLLTDRQLAIYQLIAQTRIDYGTSPTLREIASRLGLRSINGVAIQLKAMRRKGYVDWEASRYGSLRLRRGTPILGEVR